MRHTRLAKGEERIRKGVFSLYKPNSNGPLEAGGRGNSHSEVEQRILNQLRWIGWDEKFAEKIVTLKRRVFKDERCYSPTHEGQIESANFELKKDNLKILLCVNRFYVYMNLQSVDGKKRHDEVDKIHRTVKEVLPQMEFVIERSRQYDGKYLVSMKGGFDSEKGKKYRCGIAESLFGKKTNGQPKEEIKRYDGFGC